MPSPRRRSTPPLAATRDQTYAGLTALVRATRFGRATAINLFGRDGSVPAAVITDVYVNLAARL